MEPKVIDGHSAALEKRINALENEIKALRVAMRKSRGKDPRLAKFTDEELLQISKALGEGRGQ